jgi:hypothetical protein
MENQSRQSLVLLLAIIFLIIGCATTSEIERRTVRVERERISGELEFIKPELSINPDGQLIKIDTRIRAYEKIKETEIDEVHLREKNL